MLKLKAGELKPGEKKKLNVNSKEVLLINLGAGKYYAFDNKCPHLGCDLYKVGVVIREELICQCHFTHFSLKTGEARKGATKKPLKVYPVRVVGDEVIIET